MLRRRRLRARKSEPRGTLVIASSSGLSHWSLTETLAVGTGPGNYTCPSGQRGNSASAAKSLDVFYRNLRNRRKTASFSHGGQLFFSFEESAYAFIYSVVGVNFPGEIEEAVVEIVHGHLARFVVDIEEGTKFPCLLFQDPVLPEETIVEWRSGECGHYRDLDLVQATSLDEIPDVVEGRRVCVVQAKDEAPVYGDPCVLDFLDSICVAIDLVELPVCVLFDSIKGRSFRALQSDQDLRAAAFFHELQELWIIGYRNVCLREPLKL